MRRRGRSTPRSARWAGFRSVLCPVDFSAHSAQALTYAETIARRWRAALTVLYVNDPLLVAAASAALHVHDLVKQSRRELTEFIEATGAPHPDARPRVKTRVAVGSPADEILAAARRARTDLIVVGTHGVTGAGRLLLGSTTLSVMQRAMVPVLAIPSAAPPIANASPSWPGDRIVAALELDDRAGTDVDVAARIAEWLGASLLLVHVVGDMAAPAWLGADLAAHDRTRVARARQQLDVLAARSRKRVATDARVVCGRVADEIAAIAAAERTGLLITALRDRRGWFGARRGAISYHVLTHGAAPVLACPPRWRPR